MAQDQVVDEVVEETPEDEFANAFAELTEPEGKKEEPVAATAEEPTEEAVTDEPAEPAAEVETAPVQEQADEDSSFAAQIAKLREEIKPQAAPAQAEPEPVQAETPPALLTEDDQKFLKQYEEDWPDISRAEALKRRAEMHEVVKYVFAEVAKAYAPLVEHYKESSYNDHLGSILDRHEDYDQVRDQVIDWVQTQKPAMKRAFNEVVQSGTADEIADLIDVWKEATGKSRPAATDVQPAATETQTKAKQAAQRLSVVSSKRTGIPAAQDPNDFDAAFAEFAKG